MLEDGSVIVCSGVNFEVQLETILSKLEGGGQVVCSRGGDGNKFLLVSRPICFGKLSAGRIGI